MAEVRSPGVYFEPSEQRIPPLELGVTGVPVFLGLTRRGPLDRPVRVNSFERFVELFGDPLPQGYLGPALRGFFDNGGDHAFILRVARVAGREGEDIALPATRTLVDREGTSTLVVRAQDPGEWGNQVRVSLMESPPVRTLLTRDGEVGDLILRVKSTHGLAPGGLVKVHDAQGEAWSVIGRVEGKTLVLITPLPRHFASAAPTYVTALSFELRVRDFEREERFDSLSLFGQSPRFVERVINEQSRMIRVQILRPGTRLDHSLPMDVSELLLQGGSDGLTDLGPEDFIGHDRGPSDRRGLMSLGEHTEADLVALPDLMAAFQQSRRFRSLRDVEAVQDAAINVCARSSNRFVVLDPPPGGDFEEALRWRQQFDSPFAALYFPWVVCVEGQRRAIPPCGHIAGIISRSDRAHGVHKAPANEIIEGVVDLEIVLQDAHLGLLNEAGINCLRPFGPRGLRVFGARTLSSDNEWRYVNVRRTVSSIAHAVENGTQWAIFERNGPTLWKRLTRLLAGFLAGLREKGVLAGSTPEQAFFVQCDEETNPPEDIDRGMLVTRIGLAVTRPVEFIVFRLSQRLEDQAQADEE